MALNALLGKDLDKNKGRVVRSVGEGKVIYHAHDCYPEDRAIRSVYEQDLRALGNSVVATERERGWVRGTKDVSFAVYDWGAKGLRTIYLLNIDWRSEKKTAPATLLFGKAEIPLRIRSGRIETVTLSENIAVLPDAMDADVLDIQEDEKTVAITIQSDQGTVLHVASRNSGVISTVQISDGGVRVARVSK